MNVAISIVIGAKLHAEPRTIAHPGSTTPDLKFPHVKCGVSSQNMQDCMTDGW